jgi:hypothetical protein
MVAMRERKRQRSTREDAGDEGGRDDGGSPILRMVKDGAQAAGEQIRKTLGEATGAVLDTVLDEAERLYKQQRKNAVARVSSVSKIAARAAHALHAVKADGVADYVEEAAKHVERSTDYLRDRSLTEILEDTGDVIRRNRGAAIGGMFVVGFVAARFLKASGSREDESLERDGGRSTQKRPAKRSRQR